LKSKFADERGLLNLVFHPEYNSTGSLFYGVFIVINSEIEDPKLYSSSLQKEVPKPDHMTCISQYVYSRENTPEMTKKSRKNILCVPEPEANHNGGGLLFGTDGYLWIGLGDGGGANDEHGNLLNPALKESFLGNAQNLESLHGKILRIEVVQPMEQSIPYAIPQNNPLVGVAHGRKEIADWGFRNPWRMSLDLAGNILVGDVGQNRIESVKLVDRLGGNYGWRAMEGNEIFNQSVLEWIAKSNQEIVLPIITYPRDVGVAIVGVEQYNGNLIPELKERIIIADHGGRIVVASPIMNDKSENSWRLETLFKLPIRLNSLNYDSEKELYLSAFNSDTKISTVYKLDKNRKTIPTSSQISTIPSTSQEKEFLTDDDLNLIIKQGLSKARRVKSIFRRNNQNQPTHVRMRFSIITRGAEKATLVHSMPDAWDGSIDISMRKAYTAVSFSSDQNALTSRTIGVASQPGNPLWQIGNSNPLGGIIEFPGGVPLYKNGVLVGAIGVSGDGVDQDEAVAKASAEGYQANPSIRSDQVAGLPYFGDQPVEELLPSQSI
jgi:uncharacterized protein GlcG (DUF336 family)